MGGRVGLDRGSPLEAELLTTLVWWGSDRFARRRVPHSTGPSGDPSVGHSQREGRGTPGEGGLLYLDGVTQQGGPRVEL